MNAQETKENIAVMQAFADGEQIEFRDAVRAGTSMWTACHFPNWNWSAFEYRVKSKPPVPEVRYVNEYRDGSGYAETTEKKARRLDSPPHTKRAAIKYVEVTPEVAAALAKEGIKY